jgi:hypothetical protein
MDKIEISNEENYFILSNFLNNNSDSCLLSKNELFQLSIEKKPTKLTWFGFTEEHIHDVNPYRYLVKWEQDKKDKILFAFKNGVFFSSVGVYFTLFRVEKTTIFTSPLGPIALEDFSKINIDYFNTKTNSHFKIRLKNYPDISRIKFEFDEIELLKDLIKNINERITIIENEIKLREQERLDNLNISQKTIITELDSDSNGQVDLVDGESFNRLLNKNQKSIVEVDKNYIQKFVKISMYLKTKKSNTQKIFESISETKDDEELTELVNLLKNQVHTYDLLVFHSINMITSLVDSDLITFYEIYECFDQLGVFNSNWENEVSNKLTDIGEGIRDLMYSIYQMENRIVNAIDNLTYTTQDSFKELNLSVNNQLSSIDSSIKFNNLLTGIQTYQMYKINQNTRRIN